MPTYEYKCRDCGHTFDVQQSFSEDALTVCPACEGSLRKVFSPVGIAFKGSGFYKTDSRSGNGKSANGAKTESSSSSDAPGKSDSSTSDSGKSDSGTSDSGKSSSDTKGSSSTEKKSSSDKKGTSKK